MLQLEGTSDGSDVCNFELNVDSMYAKEPIDSLQFLFTHMKTEAFLRVDARKLDLGNIDVNVPYRDTTISHFGFAEGFRTLSGCVSSSDNPGQTTIVTLKFLLQRGNHHRFSVRNWINPF